MTKLIRRNWIHLVIWTGMLIYVAVATPFYARYVLKDGKPIAFDKQIPKPTERITYSVDRFDPAILRGQNLYHMWGWAFIQGESDPTIYERVIVLQSDTQNYFFPSEEVSRPDVQALFNKPKLNLTHTGFSAYLSKDVIKPGTYQIGILFQDRTNGALYYIVTNKSIVRTPNQLQLLIPEG